VRPGLVGWPAVQSRLAERGIVLVGGCADEASRTRTKGLSRAAGSAQSAPTDAPPFTYFPF